MNIIEENKLMDKVSDVLNEINKSEKNIEKSYFSMSLFEIKHRNDTNKVPKKKDESSTLTVTEKMRYGKIGDNFIKGASEEYTKIIEKVKKEERKKYKEKQKDLQRLQSQNTEDIKKEIKKSKKTSKTKLVLIGGAIAISAFLLKKTFDFLIYQSNKFNFFKVLSDYLPQKISFVKSKIDEMDESASTFVLETTGGEKVSISDETYSKNPIEDAAKSFDNILKTYVFDKGINNLINNIKEDNSIIGYMIFRPVSVIINKLMRFSKEALTTNRYFHGMGADLFHFIQTCLSPFLSLDETLSKNYEGRYKSLIIKSLDGYTSAIAKLEKLLRDSTPAGGKIGIGSYYGRDVELTISGMDGYLQKAKEAAIGSSGEFLTFFRKANSFNGVKIGNVEIKGNAGISARVEYDTGPLEGVHFVVDTTKGTSHLTVGRSWGWFGGGGPEEESIEYAKSLSSHSTINHYEKLIKENISNLPKLLLEIRAWRGYNENFLKPREQMLELINDDVEIYNSNTVETYTDYLIYFQNNLKTYEKVHWLINHYFNPSDKSKNFFLEYLKNMEIRSEWAKIKSLTVIDYFADTITPLRHLYDEEETSPIRQFFNNSKVKILSEHNNQYGNFGSSTNSLIYKLSNFSNKKLEMKNLLYEILTRMGTYLFNTRKKYVKYYKEKWNTSHLTIKIETEYINPSDDNDINIKHICSGNVTCEINENFI